MILKFSNKALFFLLIIITPIIDTINGWMIFNYTGATGLSLGTLYRAILLLYFFFLISKDRRKLLYFIITLYFILMSVIKGIFDSSLIAYITYALKWVFPLMIIMGIRVLYKEKSKNKEKDLLRILDNWSILMPALLIFEYVFKLGGRTYYDAGFKGYFYSTNDIAFSLIILFIYSFASAFSVIDRRHRYIISSLLNAIGIIILGTKSCLIIMMLTIVYFWILYLIKTKRIDIFLVSAFLIAICIIIGWHIFNVEINSFFLRYINMWNIISAKSDSKGVIIFWSDFMNFATSARTERIGKFFGSLIGNQTAMYNILVGWITPDNATVIEMDWLDLICQYGAIGVVILVPFYLNIAIHKSDNKIFSLMFWVGIIYTSLGGHVINGALSGTIFGIICAMYYEPQYIERSGRDFWKIRI